MKIKLSQEKEIILGEYKNFLLNGNSPKTIKNPEYYLQQYSYFKDLANAMPCAVYILDYASQKYLFVSDSCKSITGYTNDEFIVMGQTEFIKRCMHQEDAKLFTNKVFSKFIESAKQISGDELKSCRFSLNYRFKRKDEAIIKILQQSVVLETNDLGYPMLILGIITDITAHKPDHKMVFSMSHYNDKTGFKTLSSDSFSADTTKLTLREKEIIKHIVYGHNTPQISEILKISPFTVNAHRRNIYEKVNCKNVAELISFAVNAGIS